MFFEMRFDFGTLDSGERSLPFGLLVFYDVLPFHIVENWMYLPCSIHTFNIFLYNINQIYCKS